MDMNRYLPALVSAVVALIVFGAIGLVALNWATSERQRLLIRRALLVLVLVTVGGPLIYWLSTWAVEGGQRHTVDRGMQQKQQDELRQRINKGGH
jgi:hypothetical protein